MKHLFILICLSFSFSTFAVGQLSFGQLIVQYFDELLPIDHLSYENVDVEYTDVSRRTVLEAALQKGIFHKMFPNADIELDGDRVASARDLTTLLNVHFGIQLRGSDHPLTPESYEAIMQKIRSSYAYTLIQNQNTSIREVPLAQKNTFAITQAPGFDVLDGVYRQLRKAHLDAETVSDEQLIFGAAAGLADSYGDPYTSFLDPVDVNLLNNDLTGSYAGIGAYVEVNDEGMIVITGTLPESPAREAGLRAGDILTSVEGTEVNPGDDLFEVVDRILGEPGSAVRISIDRKGVTKRYTLVRAQIHIPFLDDELLDSGDYLITIHGVGSHADEEFEAALTRYLESEADKLILDLRDNPGGTLGETRVMLDYLLPRNKRVVSIKTQGETLNMFSYEPPLFDVQSHNIVILINGGTGSAAEIIAATLKDYFPKQVTLVGETSYGKGSVQQVIRFSNGAGLKYTTAKWFTGKNKIGIDGKGIAPDHVVPFREDLWRKGRDIQLEAAQIIDVD